MPSKAAIAWMAVIGTLGIADAILDSRHEGLTLSEVTRELFRIETIRGRTTFTLALVGGGFAFHRHITGPKWRLSGTR